MHWLLCRAVLAGSSQEQRLRVVLRIVSLGLTAVALAVAGRRLWWLKRLAFSGAAGAGATPARADPRGG